MKIRNRLTYRYTILVASILLVFSVTVYYIAAANRKARFFDNLREIAFTTAFIITEVEEVDADMLHLMDQHDLTVLPEETVIIYDSLNNAIYQSDKELSVSVAELDNIRRKEKVFWMEGKRQVAGVLFTDAGEQQLVVVAAAIDQDGLRELANLRTILGVCLVITIGVVAASGWYFAGKSLAPITTVVREVEQINASNLYNRISEGNENDEIAHLVRTFNKVLQRLESSFALQKTFVANASHELRTPLSVITSNLEVSMLRKRNPDEYESIIQTTLEDIRNITALYNKLLVLAQTDMEASVLQWKFLQVDELLWEAREELIQKKPEYKISVHYSDIPENEEQLQTRGDEQLLKVAFLNIMENGCKFSADKKVAVDITLSAQQIMLTFQDNGVGISPAEIQRIFEPFFRGENAMNITGHGIGLSLTQKIIILHKGTIQLHSQPAKGTTVTLNLPAR